jgi:GGDEF domain-containing protein
MSRFDQTELDNLERREFHLSLLASVFVMVLAGGTALLMYPVVFVHPDEASKWTLRIAFLGFCVLTMLFVAYLFDRQRTVRKLKQHLVEELKRNVELRVQANVDLLRGLSDLSHFHDQLAMEFRRASGTQRPLSLISVKVNLSSSLSGEKEITNALGEAVKGITRNLRPSDSIYLLGHGFFGVVMPDTDSKMAGRVALQIEETLKTIGDPTRFTFEITTRNFPEQVQSARELEEVVSSQLTDKESWAEVSNSL